MSDQDIIERLEDGIFKLNLSSMHHPSFTGPLIEAATDAIAALKASKKSSEYYERKIDHLENLGDNWADRAKEAIAALKAKAAEIERLKRELANIDYFNDPTAPQPPQNSD